MSLYDILACPVCKVRVEREAESLKCTSCGQKYPIVRGVPVLFPGGGQPVIEHDNDCVAQPNFYPWVHRIIMQSLLDDQVVIYVGSGNMVKSDPCIVRMDIKWTPHVDVVADAHHLPFLPGSVDFIFSSAVFEHLRQPFQAAQEIRSALKDGGYMYHDCNFIFAYHGYPHHYFNATLQGMEQLFANFRLLRKGVAPFQMPSFAIQMLVGTYLQHTTAAQHPLGKKWVKQLTRLMELNSMWFDRFFTEEAALHVAAGTYVSGIKQDTPTSTLIPSVIRTAWQNDSALQARIPDPENLTTANNLMVWAFTEGRAANPAIDEFLKQVKPFNKRGPAAPWNRQYIKSEPFVEPTFGVHPHAKRPGSLFKFAEPSESAPSASATAHAGAADHISPTRRMKRALKRLLGSRVS